MAEITWVVTPKVLGGVLTLSANILLLRYLGAEEFGVLSLCLSGILLAEAVIGAPYDLAVLARVPLFLHDGSGRDLALERAALGSKLLLSIALAAVAVASLLYWAGPLLRQDGVVHLVPLSCAAAIFLVLCRSALVHLQVRRCFRRYGITDFSQLCVKFGGIGLLLLLARPSAEAVLFLHALGPAVASILGFGLFSRPLWLGRLASSNRRWARREVFHLVKWFVLTNALGATMSGLDLFLLGALGSLEEVGIFAGARVFAAIPELLGYYLGIVLQPRIMPHWRNGTFPGFFLRVQGVLLAGVILGYGAVLGCRDWLWAALIPPSYQASAEILMVLLPGTLLGTAAIPVSLSFVLFVRPKLLFIVDCLTLPLLFGAYWLLIPAYGLMGTAWTTCVYYLIRSGLVQVLAWQLGRRARPSEEAMDDLAWWPGGRR